MENTTFCCMLVGSAGAGKSSFINTLIKYVNTTKESGQKMTRYIPTAKSQVMGGHTMTREPIKLTDDLIIVDNRGWHDWNNEAALKELSAQIHGKRSFDDDVKWDDDSDSATDDESETTLAITDKVDCTALVLNGVGGIDAVENITELIETCRQNTKRPPSIVITHKDAISDEEVKKMIGFLENEQIDPAKIFVVKNVTSKNESLDDNTRSCICDFIGSCQDDGEAGASAHRRRENVEEKREKKKVSGMQKEIEKGQHELKKAEIAEAKARLESETETKKEMDSMKEAALKRELESAERLQDMSEANRKKMNDLRLKNESDMHAHHKIVVKEYYEGRLRKE
ncbi:uncharacterized protein LOC115917995 [Strongylocentrotus purpuratus]|uniref:KAP NTPase domain-containing protein n=1 Tax=Strongylocentrotus purpuratus TaxID=7668 RepID=A0A7M7NAY7_STRPU|nr:uncharacterized protein LOC115917995 [Strongylocentrotus purpuratus]